MARIVGGFGVSHVLFSPKGVEAQAERILVGMMEIRQRIARLEPDVIVAVSSDHANNFTLRQQVAVAVGVADEYTPLGDMGLPRTPFPGCRALAEVFAQYSAPRGFDLVQTEEVSPDHGMMITKLVADPTSSIPVMPVFMNANMPLPLSPDRAYDLGRVFQNMIADGIYDKESRIIVIAGGGLSHWLRVPGEGRIAEEFDLHFLGEMASGRAQHLAQMSLDDLRQGSGNGGLELTSWLFMAGCMPHARGETIFYEPVSPWATGMGGLALTQ